MKQTSFPGADVNAVDDSQGISPLIDVCATSGAKNSVKDATTHVQRSLDVVDLLLRNGADVNMKERQEVGKAHCKS